jgi:hypothetical protein
MQTYLEDMQIWVSTFPYFFDQQRSSAGNLASSTVDGSGRSVSENGVREKRPIRDRAVLRAE